MEFGESSAPIFFVATAASENDAESREVARNRISITVKTIQLITTGIGSCDSIAIMVEPTPSLLYKAT